MNHSIELTNVVEQNKKIHPHKFTLWVAIGSIMMMFAGLTSAYMVKREQPGWTSFEVPVAFFYSTAVILISSLTMYFSVKFFRERSMIKYKNTDCRYRPAGSCVYGPSVFGIQASVAGRNRVKGIRRRSVFIYYCRLTCASCTGRSYCPVYPVCAVEK